MYFIGYDIGSSSVKASLIDGHTGNCVASAYYPEKEMQINSPKKGWAEQNPEDWWRYLKHATKKILYNSGVQVGDIKAIGISYQMHGLVLVDKQNQVLRPSIIWCDSRATEIGQTAFQEIGSDLCMNRLLNSPANFTASKLKWVKENEPEIYGKIDKILLPGDYIAMRLTGKKQTTISGLSEGIFWDFQDHEIADFLLNYYELDKDMIPEIVPTFSHQGKVCEKAARELGLQKGTMVSYRAGDQPNNAFSLNVLEPGQIASTAGTSGVIYGVNDKIVHDPLSRVNTFAHVNHSPTQNRLGVLLCINGTGIMNSWIKNIIGNLSYNQMNSMANTVAVGSEGLIILPFGNGSERILENKNIESQIHNINFNIHNKEHMCRAAQEGIVFSLFYGMAIMKEMGMQINVIKAGYANMFMSNVFRETLANLSGASIELFETDGSIGAARGAGFGYGYYNNLDDATSNIKRLKMVEPVSNNRRYLEAYENWFSVLEKSLGKF